MRSILPLAGLLLLCALPALRAQTPSESAHDLVKDVVYNELQERRQVSLWQYRVDKRAVSQILVEQEVETVSGPVYRVLTRQGKPLDPAAQKKETDRLNNLAHSSSEQARMKQDYAAEEQHVEHLIAAMPEAFLYEYDGASEGSVRLTFRPNPAYNPSTYEGRVYHALSGEVWIQTQFKRLLKIDARITTQIDFGFGLLGKIEKGGTFQVERKQVSPDRWKTSLVDVHISGHIILFKSISKDEHELRSDFKPMPPTTTVQDAVTLLKQLPSP